MTVAAVELEGLLQRKAHFELGPIDLIIPKGYVTAIVGQNGSGKSTLFRLMMGLTKPEDGAVRLLGQKVGDDDSVSYKTRIGYVPEEAIDFDYGLSGTSKADFERKWYPHWDGNYYRDLLRRFQIDPGLKLNKMSKGMRRKYDLSLAMAHHPELLLLDEPSSGLDPIAWKTMIDVLHRYMERGNRTVVMASHIVDEVRRLADYIVFVVQGKVLGIFEKDTLLESWQSMYIDAGNESVMWKGMPGFINCTLAGGTTFKVVTSQAYEAEEWLANSSSVLISKQKLELDEILMYLTEHMRGEM